MTPGRNSMDPDVLAEQMVRLLERQSADFWSDPNRAEELVDETIVNMIRGFMQHLPEVVGEGEHPLKFIWEELALVPETPEAMEAAGRRKALTFDRMRQLGAAVVSILEVLYSFPGRDYPRAHQSDLPVSVTERIDQSTRGKSKAP